MKGRSKSREWSVSGVCGLYRSEKENEKRKVENESDKEKEKLPNENKPQLTTGNEKKKKLTKRL